MNAHVSDYRRSYAAASGLDESGDYGDLDTEEFGMVVGGDSSRLVTRADGLNDTGTGEGKAVI